VRVVRVVGRWGWGWEWGWRLEDRRLVGLLLVVVNRSSSNGNSSNHSKHLHDHHFSITRFPTSANDLERTKTTAPAPAATME
jgi:hypothetical protein